MAEEKPRKSFRKEDVKNPFSRVKDSSSTTMRKSWSTNSLASLTSQGVGKSTCVCAPTKHEGSFRCRLHRTSQATSFDASSPAGQLLLPKPLLSSLTENTES